MSDKRKYTQDEVKKILKSKWDDVILAEHWLCDEEFRSYLQNLIPDCDASLIYTTYKYEM